MSYEAHQEESSNHLFVHCRWASMLWHLSFSLLGGQIGATWDYLRREDGLEKKIEEKLASRKLENDSVGNIVKYLLG